LPDLVTMENVPQLARHSVFDDFTDLLEDLGYSVTVNVVDCTLYGMPQTRKRLVLFGSKYGRLEILPPTQPANQPVTAREAIAGLPAIKAGEVCPTDALHRACSLSPVNLRRIRVSRPGGTWRDWDRTLRAKCHRKKQGKSYPGVYGRMEWDKPAPTITTEFFGFGNGRFGHPEQDRAITPREAALLQTFPAGYEFLQPDAQFSMKGIGRLIGNAVPVRLGEVIGMSLRKHLEACHE